jgi:hypothetical protein
MFKVSKGIWQDLADLERTYQSLCRADQPLYIRLDTWDLSLPVEVAIKLF